MPVAQTIQPQELEALRHEHGSLCAHEVDEQTPHETEAFLTREQAVVELLEVHAEEENRRQKCLARFRVAVLTVTPGAFLSMAISIVFYNFPTKTLSKDGAMLMANVASGMVMVMYFAAAWNMSGWRKNTPLSNSLCSIFSDRSYEEETPLFSSPLQQNVITAMLIYSDEPRFADALCRALEYYRKDQNLLYVRLARLLPLLPSDGSALTETAQRTLFNIKNRTVESTTSNEKEQMLPVLQAAAKEYFARTGEPAPRPKRKWFKQEQAAPQNAKETG